MSSDLKSIRKFLKRKPPVVLAITDPIWERYVQNELMNALSDVNQSLLGQDSHFSCPTRNEEDET